MFSSFMTLILLVKYKRYEFWYDHLPQHPKRQGWGCFWKTPGVGWESIAKRDCKTRMPKKDPLSGLSLWYSYERPLYVYWFIRVSLWPRSKEGQGQNFSGLRREQTTYPGFRANFTRAWKSPKTKPCGLSLSLSLPYLTYAIFVIRSIKASLFVFLCFLCLFLCLFTWWMNNGR